MVIVWLLVSISPPLFSRTVCGAVIRVKIVDLWQIRAFKLVTFLLASRSILGRGWKMQRRAAAQLQMNGAICLVTRGRQERLQPNCTWSPVLTPARRFPLQGKKQKNRREGEREKQILPHQALLQSLQSPSHFPSPCSPAALSAGFDTSICFSFWPFNVLSVSACKSWADVWGQFLVVPLVSEWLRTLYIWGACHPATSWTSLYLLCLILRQRNRGEGMKRVDGKGTVEPILNNLWAKQACTLSVRRAEPSGQAWPITPWKHVLEQTPTSMWQTPVQRVFYGNTAIHWNTDLTY